MEKGSWTTLNEIKYLDGLICGKWVIPGKIIPEPEVLLTSYIRSAKKRKACNTFGKVDADKVIAYAENTLSRLQ